LWWRAPLRLVRGGTWGALVTVVFLSLAVAAAAHPLAERGAQDAAMSLSLAAVPEDARAAEAPVLRLTDGGELSQTRQERFLDQVRAVPGLSDPEISGGSIGVELDRTGEFRPFVEVDGSVRAARLYGDADPAGSLVPVGATAEAGGRDGVWMGAELAEQLAVVPGDTGVLGVETLAGRTTATVTVVGVYAVAADGRMPADAPGGVSWASRRGALPGAAGDGAGIAHLLVADNATAARLGAAVGDRLLWIAQARLEPQVPSLDAAAATAEGIRQLTRRVIAGDAGSGPEALRQSVVSGIPEIVDRASAVAADTVQRVRSLLTGALVLAVVAVGLIAASGAARRRVELVHAAGLGTHPLRSGLHAGLEVGPAAVLAVVAGPLLAGGLVTLVGPAAALDSAGSGSLPGSSLPGSLWSAVGWAAAAAVLGIVIVVAVVTAAAARVAALRRPAGTGARGGATLAEVGLVTAAAVVLVGLLVRPTAVPEASGMDLLAPLLVVAAVGALGARAAAWALARLRPAGSGRVRSGRRAVWWLAARRAAVVGTAEVAVVAVLATGFGMLLYAYTAADSVTATVEDRIAVQAGAAATARIEGSWVLDSAAPAAPEPDPNGELPRGISGPRTPPLPVGTTAFWSTSANIPGRVGDVELLVVDPDGFVAAALWSGGPELVAARAAMQALADAPVPEPGQWAEPVPAVVVGEPDLPSRIGVSLAELDSPVAAEVLGSVAVLPGHDRPRPAVVVPADAVLPLLGRADPRFAPPPDRVDGRSPWVTELWSAEGPAGIEAALRAGGGAAGAVPGETTTADLVASQPRFVAARSILGLQLALGAALALTAAVVLCLVVDRAAATSRAADALLARVGLGRRGPVLARAVEIAATVALAAVLAVAGAALVAPLAAVLLDADAAVAPALVLRIGAGGVLLVLLAAAATAMLAILTAAVRARTGSDATVLRDAE
jgi:hypothetical protein